MLKQKYPDKPTIPIEESHSTKFFRNFRILENSKNENQKYNFVPSGGGSFKERKLTISPTSSNYQTPRSTMNQSNYNVTVINVNKIDINNFKLSEQNFRGFSTPKGTRALDDFGTLNIEVDLKEKEQRILELKKEIQENRAQINQMVHEKQQLQSEEVFDKRNAQLQTEDRLKQLGANFKDVEGKLSSRERESARNLKADADFQENQLNWKEYLIKTGIYKKESEKQSKDNSSSYHGTFTDKPQLVEASNQNDFLKHTHQRNNSVKIRHPKDNSKQQSNKFHFYYKNMEMFSGNESPKKHFFDKKLIQGENNNSIHRNKNLFNIKVIMF